MQVNITMKSQYLFIALFISIVSLAQAPGAVLNRTFIELEKDPQLQHALIGFYVSDKAGKIVFEKNADIGMAPASTLKILTSVSSFELLGKDYQFKTQIAIDGEISKDGVGGNLYFIGGGDPTLGSTRWASTRSNIIVQKIRKILADKKIKQIQGGIFIEEKHFSYPPLPQGWIWEDIGNYYGAGAWGLNWMENKYAVHLASATDIGKPASIVFTSPLSFSKQITNQIISAAKGTGDNAYLFSAPYSEKIFATGTIPAGESNFIIYGAMPEPGKVFLDDMQVALADIILKRPVVSKGFESAISTVIGTVYSPPLDSINYWFLKESVNLFGEALINNIAFEKGKNASTAAGVDIVRNFWTKNGLEKSAIKIIDGSGLSPANRITPKALVHVLSFAKGRGWFNSFYHALPEMNGIKMKSGYIGGVRSYAGYVKSKSGEEYTFAFIINNFDGAASSVREKMYKVLNLLK